MAQSPATVTWENHFTSRRSTRFEVQKHRFIFVGGVMEDAGQVESEEDETAQQK